MLGDAVAEELIRSNPCVLQRGELPKKKDKDPTWRRGAVFPRDEVQTVISAEAANIPEDRRTLYAIMFLGAMRFGEAAALTRADYDAACSPLGKLVVERSYNTKSRKVKETKTENPARDAGPSDAGPDPGRIEARRFRAAHRPTAEARGSHRSFVAHLDRLEHAVPADAEPGEAIG